MFIVILYCYHDYFFFNNNGIFFDYLSSYDIINHYLLYNEKKICFFYKKNKYENEFFLDYVPISELFKLYPKYFPILLEIKKKQLDFKISFDDIYILSIYNTSNKK